MNYLQKFGKISIFALLVVMPSVTFASSVVTSQDYVDIQDGLDEKLSNKLNGTATTGQKIGDLPAGGAAGQDQVMYPSAAAVKEYAVAKNQGTGTNNANVGKTLVVNSSGVLELDTIDALPAGTAAHQMLQYNATTSEWDVVNIDTTPTAGNTVPVTSGGVKTGLDAKQTKPTSGVANGKVLTYSCANDPTLCSDANTSVSAAYVTVPVAAGTPSTNTPTAFSEVWVQSL